MLPRVSGLSTRADPGREKSGLATRPPCGRTESWCAAPDPREPLHAHEQPLVLAPLGADLGHVRPLEPPALDCRRHHRRHVGPALALLERLDLAMEAEDVRAEVGIDAEAREGDSERIAPRRRLEESLACHQAMAETPPPH